MKDIIQDGKTGDVGCGTASVADLCPTFIDIAVISSSRVQWTQRALTTKPPHCLETMDTYHLVMQQDSPDEWRPHLNCTTIRA
jgi:hypothetical protein